MSASALSPFPLVGLQAVANAHNEWVAVKLELPSEPDAALPALTALLAQTEVWAALETLDCIIALDDPRALGPALLDKLAPQRFIFCLPLEVCGDKKVQQKCRELGDAGYRLMIAGAAGVAAAQTGARALCFDARAALPPLGILLALPGPHLALAVDDMARFGALRAAGFGWYAGAYPLTWSDSHPGDDGTSRKRLLALLGLLARDADSRELEQLVKQDPALSYHLLKLVNSAAFGFSTPISNFAQAINLLGRRQLQRWLQLLLYARQQEDGAIHPLLPLAAARAAQMEALCRQQGGDRDQQDQAFMAGVFALLPVLLAMPMADIVGALNLDRELAAALLERGGALGALLRLAECGRPDGALLAAAGVTPEDHWRSLLQAVQWAAQVSRNI